MKNNDDDDWGATDWNDPPRTTGNAGFNSKPSGSLGGGGGGLGFGSAFGGKDSSHKEDGRSSMSSNYAGFGILGRNRSSGKKKDDDDADLLDNILDDIEEKKGIESTKKTSDFATGYGGFGLGSNTNKS